MKPHRFCFYSSIFAFDSLLLLAIDEFFCFSILVWFVHVSFFEQLGEGFVAEFNVLRSKSEY